MRILHFEPIRSLLNPSFEGYKLAKKNDNRCLSSSIPLAREPNDLCGILDISHKWEILAYRMALNSLYSNPFDSGESFYFDQQHGLWRLGMGEEEVCEQLLDSLDKVECYPSMIVLDQKRILILRGNHSRLEVLDRSNDQIRIVKMPIELQSANFLKIEKSLGPQLVITSIEEPSNGRNSLFRCFLLNLDMVHDRLEIIAVYKSHSRPSVVHMESDGLVFGSQTPFASNEEDDVDSDPKVHNQQVQIPYKWEQDKDFVYINIDFPVKDAKPSISLETTEVTICLEEKTILSATPYSSIDLARSSWSMTDTTVLVTLSKMRDDLWPSPWKQPADKILDSGFDDPSPDPSQDLNQIVLVKYSSEKRQQVVWKSAEIHCIGPYLSCDDSSLSLSIAYGDDALAYLIDGRHHGPLHVHTFDAMSFVVAGKQNRRYVVFSTHYSIIIESTKHVFLYKTRLANDKSKYLPQYLVSLEDNTSIIGWSLLHDNLLIILSKRACHLISLPED